MSEYLKSFDDQHKKYQPAREERRQKAVDGMGEGYKTDINKYDIAAKGNKRFDHADLKYLRNAGYDDDQIATYAQGLGADKLSEGIRHNHGNIAGEFATKAMAEGASISDHDYGKGFNKADLKYLRNQGFSDSEISDHIKTSVTEKGARHGNAIAQFMDKQGKLDYNYGDWNTAETNTEADTVGETAAGTGTGTGTGTETSSGGSSSGGSADQQAQSFMNKYKYKVGKYTHKSRDYSKVASNISNRALAEADATDLPELKELQKSVDKNPLYWKARSDEQTGNYLGDIWNFEVGDFKMPKPMNPVEAPDIDGIADKWSSKIDSIKPEL